MADEPLTQSTRFRTPGPKRILALDGGGLRGIVSLAFLKRIESLLKERHGNDPDFRLCHYFDLIAGTSTGAIIAAGLAAGMSADELISEYKTLGHKVFKRSFWRRGFSRARYSDKRLISELKRVFGDLTLGDERLQTGLLIVTKRMDTGSPWPLGNNPRGRYYRAGPKDNFIDNADLPLWSVVRASTAAPTFFVPEKITIAEQVGKPTVKGHFIDGGVSPFNNPALQALMYATLDGFKVQWPLGEDRLLLVSVGTGTGDPSQHPSRWAGVQGIQALQSLMDDCGALVEIMMQWLSNSPLAREIDGEIGRLDRDLLTNRPACTYQRYQLDLTRKTIDRLKRGISDKQLAALTSMDRPDQLQTLYDLGLQAAEMVSPDHFPTAFDLPAASSTAGEADLKRYRRRDNTPVTAIPLDLVTSRKNQSGDQLFTYYKWDDTQTAKTGDWLVKSGDEVYTVERQTFEDTYTHIGRPGQYVKTNNVWAKRATQSGTIQTKEGSTRYEAGDYLVFNDPGRQDGYAISAKVFPKLYEPDKP